MSTTFSELEALRAERNALKAALLGCIAVLDDVAGNINPERGFADELEGDVTFAATAARIALKLA